LGQGYAGPAVAEGRVLVFHRVAEVERLESLDAKTGQPQWSVDFPASYAGGVDPDTGPRCVPLVHGGSVYVCGAAGDLHSVTLQTGKKRWSRATYREFRGNPGYFGAGSSPLVVGDQLLLNVGGEGDAGIVAFALQDGATRWKSTAEKASYSSPTLVTVQGRQHAIFATRLTAVSLDPADGTIRFRFPFGQRGPTVNAATPLVFDGHLFLTANYGVGARTVKIGERSATPVWSNDESLSSQYATPVYKDGLLYGIHGREDVGVPDLRCVDAMTGRVRWSVPDFGTAHLILVGDKLLVFCVNGRLVLAEAAPTAFRRLSEATISQAVTRALPALSDGRLYFRENQAGAGSLRCLVLR
jgi:outer membrane protein assembly factor BamB